MGYMQEKANLTPQRSNNQLIRQSYEPPTRNEAETIPTEKPVRRRGEFAR